MLKYDTSNPQYVLYATSKNASGQYLASMVLTTAYNYTDVYKIEFIITENFPQLTTLDKLTLSSDMISFLGKAQSKNLINGNS